MNYLKRLNPIELRNLVLAGLQEMDRRNGSENDFITWSYTPDPRISKYLHQLKKFLEIKKPSQQLRKEAGYLLEKILVIAFKGLAGYTEIKSYRSGSFQLDLLISGDDSNWQFICDRIHQTSTCGRGIIVEAKAEKTPVSSAQFSRFCNILALNFCNTVGLGIFFTLEGASGFPKKGGSRSTSFKDARLCQLLFYAKTNKKIIVLDKNDIFELDKKGSLTRILIRKVKEIEEASGLPTAPTENLIDEDLPGYLKDII